MTFSNIKNILKIKGLGQSSKSPLTIRYLPFAIKHNWRILVISIEQKHILMASLNMTIPFSISREEALKRIKNLLTETKKEHGDKIDNLQEQWDGNVGTFSFTAKGYDISGTLTVEDSTIELNGKIPFAVSLFKGAITRAINEKAGELLA